MKRTIGIFTTLIVTALVATACSDKKNDDVLAQDTTLTHDLALANQDTAS